MSINSAAAPTLAAIVIQFGLGLAVFQANPKRRTNQCFLLLSLCIGAWAWSFSSVGSAGDLETAAFYIRQAAAVAAFILTSANLLRLSIQKPKRSWGGLLRDSWLWLITGAAVVAFCQTRFYVSEARYSHPPGPVIPEAVYAPASALYVAYFVIAALTVIISLARNAKQATGIRRAEFSFILTGITATLGTVLIPFVLGFFIDRSRLVWFAPFRIILFSLIVAYGIATQKIMEVGFFLRRAMSFLLLTAYLLALYGLVWWLVFATFSPLLPGKSKSVAHIMAAVVVAFAMAPARGISQSFANRLFVGTRRLDFRSTVNKATAILRSVTTLGDLIERFAKTIGEALNTDRVIILLPSKIGYLQHYPPVQSGSRLSVIEFSQADALVEYLQKNQEPIVVDELHRVRATPELLRVTRQLETLQIAVAMGIYSREHLGGIMLLGARASGQIYGSVEQSALQVLCGQLAVAIDNAQLFTEVQNAKIYNEILLQNLTTGVIAASADGVITVFNHEAEQITDLISTELLERPVYMLPLALREVVDETLRSGDRQENREIILESARGPVVVRASSSIFHGQGGQMLGVLMVLTDITALKRLELQIRRSDRLASLGTLSAGMAHEIKNPLVSIKTFAQLLPERYQDSDFRETFSNLIGHEIDRIDSLVNQLLRFARPAKPLLKPLRVHEVLEKSLMLVGHRLYQKEIKLSRSWNASLDTIRADADQLEQVFLNFFLNAMDAMKHGGELNVATEIRPAEEWASPVAGMNGERHEVLRVTVRDNGDGIKDEDIPHVFDPFFTTKDYGTGLGLSVVHGIIQEHGGQIEVESELAKGTAFHILLPLVRFEEEVAAA